MVPDEERAGRAAAIGIAFVTVVGMSSIRCGADEITDANIRSKYIQAVCDAENKCCAKQGYLCRQTTGWSARGQLASS